MLFWLFQLWISESNCLCSRRCINTISSHKVATYETLRKQTIWSRTLTAWVSNFKWNHPGKTNCNYCHSFDYTWKIYTVGIFSYSLHISFSSTTYNDYLPTAIVLFVVIEFFCIPVYKLIFISFLTRTMIWL